MKTAHLVDDAIDITRLNRADIEKQDWAKVHVDAERNPPLYLGERLKRGWRR